jgi:hypothetical protein
MKLPRKEHAKAVNTNGSFRRVIRNQLERKFDNLVGVHGFSVSWYLSGATLKFLSIKKVAQAIRLCYFLGNHTISCT